MMKRIFSPYITTIFPARVRIIRTYVNPNSILQDIDIECPDAYIIDYRLLGNMNGIGSQLKS